MRHKGNTEGAEKWKECERNMIERRKGDKSMKGQREGRKKVRYKDMKEVTDRYISMSILYVHRSRQ
jgi:hypothetical protein